MSKRLSICTRSKTIWLPDLLTKDNIPVGVSLAIVYRIDINDAKRRADDEFEDEDRTRIRTINYNWPDWEKNTQAIIEGRMQRLVRSSDFRNLT